MAVGTFYCTFVSSGFPCSTGIFQHKRSMCHLNFTSVNLWQQVFQLTGISSQQPNINCLVHVKRLRYNLSQWTATFHQNQSCAQNNTTNKLLSVVSSPFNLFYPGFIDLIRSLHVGLILGHDGQNDSPKTSDLLPSQHHRSEPTQWLSTYLFEFCE